MVYKIVSLRFSRQWCYAWRKRWRTSRTGWLKIFFLVTKVLDHITVGIATFLQLILDTVSIVLCIILNSDPPVTYRLYLSKMQEYIRRYSNGDMLPDILIRYKCACVCGWHVLHMFYFWMECPYLLCKCSMEKLQQWIDLSWIMGRWQK